MPLDHRMLQGRVFLMDENDLRIKLAQIAMFNECYSGRQVVKTQRKMLEQAKNITNSSSARGTSSGGKVAVIGVMGPLDYRYSSAMMKSGGTSCLEIAAMLEACMEDSKVSSIVMDVDSGGGSSSGIQELSDKIFKMRDEKRIYAIANTFCASAAYWIASAADTMVCSPSGEVGSVGAYVAHISEEEALKMEGIDVTLIKAGEFKAELAPFLKLSDSAKAHLQASVDDVYEKFVAGVARNRGTSVKDVKANFGKGRMLSPEAALSAGMIDKICSMEELLSKLTSGQGDEPRVERKRAETASAEVLRERQKLLQRANKAGEN